jgi:hypothetical protein
MQKGLEEQLKRESAGPKFKLSLWLIFRKAFI